MSAFADLMPMLRGALLLEDETFETMRDAPDGMARGLRFLVTIALAVGLVLALAGFLGGLLTSPQDELSSSVSGIEQAFEQMESMGVFGNDPAAEAFAETFLENLASGLQLGADVAQAVEETTPAPRVFVVLFEALARWLSLPFAWLSLWLLWGVLALFFARLLGGTATIQQMLATTSLVAAPHILDALGFIPCLGGIIGFLATLWAIVVYVKGTAIANRIGYGKATLAVFLPILIPLALGVCMIVAFALAVGGGG